MDIVNKKIDYKETIKKLYDKLIKVINDEETINMENFIAKKIIKKIHNFVIVNVRRNIIDDRSFSELYTYAISINSNDIKKKDNNNNNLVADKLTYEEYIDNIIGSEFINEYIDIIISDLSNKIVKHTLKTHLLEKN